MDQLDTSGKAEAHILDIAPSDMVIKFMSDNKIQRGVVDEVINLGFDSLESLSLMAPEDVQSPRIPVGNVGCYCTLPNRLSVAARAYTSVN